MSDGKKITVYGIRNENDFFYFGTTTRCLKRRMTEHVSTGNAIKSDSIVRIYSTNSHEEALLKETTLICLYGLARLKNKQFEQNQTEKVYSGFKRISQRKTVVKVYVCKKWAPDRRSRSIIALTGVKKSDKAIENSNMLKGYKYFNVFKDGEFLFKENSQAKSARLLGMKKSTFVDILKGKRINNKGLMVQYVD